MSCPVIELAQQLIRRPSLSPDDAGCQALMIERLRAIGFTIEPMDFGDTQNFWAWRGHGGDAGLRRPHRRSPGRRRRPLDQSPVRTDHPRRDAVWPRSGG